MEVCIIQLNSFDITPKFKSINPLIMITKIAIFLMSFNSRPSFKISRLKSDDIKLNNVVKNNNPTAANTPFPIGEPSVFSIKKGIKSIKRRKFQATIAPITKLFFIGNPPLICFSTFVLLFF